jgi:hypothetical protein
VAASAVASATGVLSAANAADAAIAAAKNITDERMNMTLTWFF